MNILPQDAHLLLQLEKCEEVIVWSSDPFVNRQFQDFCKLIVLSSDQKPDGDENILGQIYELHEKEKEQFNYILILYNIDNEINCLKLLTVCLAIFKNAYIYGNSTTVNLVQEFAQDIDNMIECFQLDDHSYSALFNDEMQAEQQEQQPLHQQNIRRVYCSMQEYKSFFDVLATNANNIKDIYLSLQNQICSHLLNFRKDELKARIKQSPLTKQQLLVTRNRILAEQFAEFHKENIEGNITIINTFQKQMNEVKEFNTLLTNSKCSHLILKEFQFFENKKDQYQEYEEFEEDIDLFYQFYMENCPNYGNKKLIILEFLTKVLKEGAKEFIAKIIQQSKYLPLPSQISNMNNSLAQEKEVYYENLMRQAQEQIEQLQRDMMTSRINYEKNIEQVKEMSTMEIEELQEKIRLLETTTRKKDNVLRDSFNKYDKEKLLLEQKIHFQDLEIMELKKKYKSQFSFNQFLNENKSTQTDEGLLQNNLIKSARQGIDSSPPIDHYIHRSNINQKESIDERQQQQYQQQQQQDDNIPSRENLEQCKSARSGDNRSDGKNETTQLMKEIKQLTDSISKKDAILKSLQLKNCNLQNEISSMQDSNRNTNRSVGIQSSPSSDHLLHYKDLLYKNQYENTNNNNNNNNQYNNISSNNSNNNNNNNKNKNEEMITPLKEQQLSSGSELQFKVNSRDKYVDQESSNREFDAEDIHQIVDNLIDIDEELSQIVEHNQIYPIQLSSSRSRQERDIQSSRQEREIQSSREDKQQKSSVNRNDCERREVEEKLEEQIVELNELIENLRRELEMQSEQISQQQEVIMQQQEEIEYLKQEQDMQQVKESEYKKQIGNEMSNNEQLMQEYEELNEVVQLNTQQHTQSLIHLQQQSYELDLKNKQINSYEIQLHQSSQTFLEAQERIKEKEEQLFQIFEQNQRLSNENIAVQQELSQSIIQRDELKNILEVCKSKIMQMEKLERQLTEQKQFIDQQDAAFYEQQEHFSSQVEQIQAEINSRYEQEFLEKEEQIVQLNQKVESNLNIIQQLQNALAKYEHNLSNSHKTNPNNFISSTHSTESHLNQPYTIQYNSSHHNNINNNNNNNNNLKLSDFQNNRNSDQSCNNSARLSGYHDNRQFTKPTDNKVVHSKQRELLQDDLHSEIPQQQQFRSENEEALLIQTLFDSRSSNNSRRNLSLVGQMKNSNINNNIAEEEVEEIQEEADLISSLRDRNNMKNEQSFSSTSRFSNINSEIQDIHHQHHHQDNKAVEQNYYKNNQRKENSERFSLPARPSHTQNNHNSDNDSSQRTAEKHEFSIKKQYKSINENGRSHTEQSQSDQQKQCSIMSNPQKELSFQDNHDDLFINSNTYEAGLNIYNKPLINSDRNPNSDKPKLNQDINLNGNSNTSQAKENQNNSNVNNINSNNIKQDSLQEFLFSDVEIEKYYRSTNNKTPLPTKQTPNSSCQNSMNQNNQKRDSFNMNQEITIQQLKLQKNLNSMNNTNNSQYYQGSSNTENSQSNANCNIDVSSTTPAAEEKLQYKENIFNFIGQKSNYLSVPTQSKVHSNPLAGQIIGQTQELRSPLQSVKPIKLENTFNRVSSQNALDLFQDSQYEKVKQQKSESLYPSPLNQASNNNRKLSKVNFASPSIHEFDLKVGSSMNEIPSPQYVKQNNSQQKGISPSLLFHQYSSETTQQNVVSVLNSSQSNHNISNTRLQQQQQQDKVLKLGSTDLFEDIFTSSSNINSATNRDKLTKENTSNIIHLIPEKRKDSNGLSQFENDLKVLGENILGTNNNSNNNNNVNKFDINNFFSQRSDVSSGNQKNHQSTLGVYENLSKKDLFGKSYLKNETGLSSIGQNKVDKKNSKFISGGNYNINSNSSFLQQPLSSFLQPSSSSVTNKKSENRFQFNMESNSQSSNNNSNLNTSRNVTPLNDRKNSSFFQSILSVNDEKAKKQNSNNKSINQINSTCSPYRNVNSPFNQSIMSTNIQPTTTTRDASNITYQSNLTKTPTNNYQTISPNNPSKQAGRTFLKTNNLSIKNQQPSFTTHFNSKI